MCSVYTEGYFGVAPIELGEVFADRSLAFVIRPLFPVLSPLRLLIFLAFLSYQVRFSNSIIDAGKGIVASINRRHKGIWIRRDVITIFLFSRSSWNNEGRNEIYSNFIEYRWCVEHIFLKNITLVYSRQNSIPRQKLLFQSIIFPILAWSRSRWNSTMTGFHIIPVQNFFKPIYLCILWSQRERVEMNIRFLAGENPVWKSSSNVRPASA